VDPFYSILLVSILIFVHESGHFAFAKIFGVKVITFSIGFGPKIVRLRGKETEYCIGLLPLGGFVKMLEESKAGAEPILPEDRKRTFESQALWKRIVIVLAGPAMNILFPIVLYTSVFLEDRSFRPPTVGFVQPGKPADGKLVPGDRILSVDGHAVTSFPEVQSIVASRAGKLLHVVVERDGKQLDLMMTPAETDEEAEEDSGLEIVDRIGRLGFRPSFPSSVIGVPRTDSPAFRANLQTFDRITAINGRKIDRMIDLVDALYANKGENVVLSYMHPVDVPNALGGLCDIAVMEPRSAVITPLAKTGETTADDANARAQDVLARTGIESAEMYAAYVPEGSSEYKAELRAGDRITTLDGIPQRSWEEMRTQLKETKDRMHELTWTRAGEAKSGTFSLRSETWEDELGPHVTYVFHTTHWVPNAPDAMVPNPHPLWYALRRGVEQTGSVVRFITVGFVRILQGRVSLSSVSGPITILDIAGQAGARGTLDFVWALAVISVNLGLINLLPIPVLDGGNLMFFALEGIRRCPVSLRVREVASLVGMTMLVLLMFVAFKNDVQKKWDVIGHIKAMFS